MFIKIFKKKLFSLKEGEYGIFRGYILDYKRGTSNIDNHHAKKKRNQTRNPSEYFIEVNMNMKDGRMISYR